MDRYQIDINMYIREKQYIIRTYNKSKYMHKDRRKIKEKSKKKIDNIN